MALQAVLERLAANIFWEPYASDGKVAGIFSPARKMPKSVALTKKVLQINGPRKIVYLSFDIDREFAGMAWDDVNLPPPNLIIVNPENLHAHLIYELANPIWLRKGDDHRVQEAPPVRYLKAVRKAMERALGADPAYRGLLTKNPFHASWLVSSACERPYTLSELSAHLDLDVKHSEVVVRESGGRRSTLFESIRLWAYREKQNFNSLEDFHDAIMAELERMNSSFEKGPEENHSLKSIAKSVSAWTWKHYECKRRGIMGLDSSESVKVRQQRGQEFTSRVRTKKTLSRIRDAITVLRERGIRVSKSAVAEVSGYTRLTVIRHWDSIQDLITAQHEATTIPEKVTVETESLRLQSPSGPCGAGQSGYPDSHPTIHPTASHLGHRYREIFASGDRTQILVAKIEMAQNARKGILVEGTPEHLIPWLTKLMRSSQPDPDKPTVLIENIEIGSSTAGRYV